MQETKNKKLFVSTLILVICHFFGLIGMLTPWRDYFLMATPVNLIISTALLLVNQKECNTPFYIFCFITFIFGYFIEVAGVKTGVIFGEYSYGKTLGLQLLNVPLVMGLNWLMLIYSVGVICAKLNTNIILKSVLGGIMLVLLDFFIEPIAVRFDFWNWQKGAVPVQNYAAWFGASFILLLLFHSLQFNKNNRLATALYIVQFVFFTLLNIF